MKRPATGTRWARRSDGRVAVIRGFYGPPFNLVMYRFVPLPMSGLRRWQVAPRTNTTPMDIERFLSRFAPEERKRKST